MHSTELIITLIIGGLIATVASSNDDILHYLQHLEDKMESKLDTLQKQCCSTTKDDDHDSSDGKSDVVKAKRIRDPFTLGNTPKKTITGLDGLWGIYIADDGIAYITGGNKKITKFDSSGNKLKEITVDKGATGIHVKGNKVFVALGDEIGIFTRDLTKTGKITISPSDGTAFAVAVDSDDKIYFKGNPSVIHVYNKDGSKSHKIDLKYGFMLTIRFDAKENIYTAGTLYDDSSVLFYTKAGIFVREFPLKGISGGPFVDNNGSIYVPGGHASPGLIYILNSSGSVIKRFQTPVKTRAALRDAVIAPDGTLWVLDASTSTIYLY